MSVFCTICGFTCENYRTHDCKQSLQYFYSLSHIPDGIIAYDFPYYTPPPAIPYDEPPPQPDYTVYPLRREVVERIQEHAGRHQDCDMDKVVNDAIWHALEEHERKTGTKE